MWYFFPFFFFPISCMYAQCKRQRNISSDIVSTNTCSRVHWLISRSSASIFVLLGGDTLATREGGVKGDTPQVSLLPLVSAAGTPPFSPAHFHFLPQNRLKERRGREGGRGGEGGRASRDMGESVGQKGKNRVTTPPNS
jgi:hypothetical protein